MNKPPGVEQTLQLLERLRSTARDFAAREKRLEDLGSRNERRIRPPVAYEKSEGDFVGEAKEFLTRKGRNPRAYTVPNG